MDDQLHLMPKEPFDLRPPDDRQLPIIWIKRLVLYEEPGKVLRDISMEPGLNIIWAPDDQQNEVGAGHGVGKTLLCRIIRYCLGEKTYANKETRKQIRTQMPDAYVGAEVVIDGVTWNVVRPLGSRRRESASKSISIEELLKFEDPAPSLDPFNDIIREVLFSELFTEELSLTGESDPWLLALAWIARDQECRLGHPLEWRSSASDSGSPLPAASKENLLTVVRAFLGAADATTADLRRQRDNNATKLKNTEVQLTNLIRRITEDAEELRSALALENESDITTPLALTELHGRTSDAYRNAKARFEEDLYAEEIAAIDSKLKEQNAEYAVYMDRQERVQVKANMKQTILADRIDENKEISTEETRERIGDSCPICYVSIEVPIDKGCPLAISKVDEFPLSVEERKNRRAQQIANLEQQLAKLDSQSAHWKAKAKNASEIRAQLNRDRLRFTTKKAAAAPKRRDEWHTRKNQFEMVEDFAARVDNREQLRGEIDDLQSKDRELKKKLLAAQTEYNDRLERLQEVFRFVCRELFGTDNECEIDILGSKIKINLGTGGQAYTAFRAIAFDLAALILGIERHASIPAFWIHDSPREADLGTSIYERYFHLFGKLMLDRRPPLFQAFIATTSPPPADLQEKPHCILKLEGSPSERFLLRTEVKGPTELDSENSEGIVSEES